MQHFTLFVLSLFVFTLPAISQDRISDVTAEYSVAINSANSAAVNSLNGATMTVYVKPLESRTEFRSHAGTETTIFSFKSAKGSILKEYSGQKLMITLTRDNWEEMGSALGDIDFQNEKDSILAGYDVKKATGIMPDGRSIAVFYTPSLKLVNRLYNFAFPQLDGLPVKFEISSALGTVSYTLTHISTEPVLQSRFVVLNTGFRFMTYEESKKMTKEKKTMGF